MNLMVKITLKKILSNLKLFSVLFFLFFLSSALFGSQTKKLIFTLGADASCLNPILYTDSASGAPVGLIFNGLMKVNEKLELVPDLAESYQVSPGGKIWTFYLRKNVFWQDGQPLTAGDVKFTFDKILDPEVNTVRRGDFIIDGEPIKFETQGNYIFKAILPRPFAPFLATMTMGVLPKHILEKEDLNHSDFNRAPLGTGPYKFVSWRSADHIKLTANKNYFSGPPKIDEIFFRIIPNATARVVALELLEVDEDSLSPLDYQRLQNNQNLKIYEYPVLAYTFLGLNLKNPLFSQIQVRQALSYAIDRQALVNSVLLGHGQVCYTPAVPASWAYTDKINKYDYHPSKALKILSALGWQKNSAGYLEKNGKIFEFTALVNQGNREREKAAVIIQEQLKRIGLKVNIQIIEWAALVKTLNGPAPKKFEAVFLGWSLGIDPDDYTIWHSSQYPAGFNFINYKNQEVDRLLESGRKTLGQKSRKKIYEKIYQILSREQPYIFLWTANALEAVNRKVKNLASPGPAGLFLNIERIELAE